MDRLVETSLPVDATDKYYPAPWLTRYKYDITAGVTDYFADASGGAHPVLGRGRVYAVNLYIPPPAARSNRLGRPSHDRCRPSEHLRPVTEFHRFIGWLTGFSELSDALGHSATFAYDGAGRTTADYDVDLWTSRDAIPGNLDNPFSYRRYLRSRQSEQLK